MYGIAVVLTCLFGVWSVRGLRRAEAAGAEVVGRPRRGH